MQKVSRKRLILNTLTEETAKGLSKFGHKFPGTSTVELAQKLSMLRNNVSAELNKLISEASALKVMERPVRYFAKAPLEEFSGKTLENSYESFVALQVDLSPGEIASTVNVGAGLDSLIGANSDLKVQVKQAKAAIFYPPHGLHIILTGSTGTGKTTFAEAVYRFALSIGQLPPRAPYVIFNCADYAENSNLLVTKLFGHAKGAYTGAQNVEDGLVKEANGGVLFLDEVHRLPPNGQEMLFSILDHGKYARLGEKVATHEVQFLLIAATTEKLEDSMLRTFLRRIPMCIHLPALAERSSKDRRKLVGLFFAQEAKAIGKSLCVAKEVLRLLTTYPCEGNIGQLKNDIRILCATALIEQMGNTSGVVMHVRMSHLATAMGTNMISFLPNRNSGSVVTNDLQTLEVTFSPNPQQSAKSITMDTFSLEEEARSFYEGLIKNITQMRGQGQSLKNIREEMGVKIRQSLSALPMESVMAKTRERIASKVMTPEIIHIVEKCLTPFFSPMSEGLRERILYHLSLHLETLLERLRQGEETHYPDLSDAEKKNPVEFELAMNLLQQVSFWLHVEIPKAEAYFITIYLDSVKQIPQEDPIPILVLAHGDGAASAMAKVTKELLGVEKIYAIDMPMVAKPENVLQEVILLVKKIDTGHGLLILADMGSLTSFGDFITRETGIPTQTLRMVSTPMVIEAARRASFPGMRLNRLAEEVSTMSTFVGANIIVKNTEQQSELKTERVDSPRTFFYGKTDILRMLGKILVFLDAQKTYSILRDVLENIVTEAGKSADKSLRIKFFFHSACLLERAVRHEPLPYKNLQEVKYKESYLFSLVQKHFTLAEEAFGISIADTELAYVVELLLSSLY